MTSHSDGQDLARELGIPEMIIGTASVSDWLSSIGIRTNQREVSERTKKAGIAIKYWASDARRIVYDRKTLKALIRNLTGVDAECWLSCRRDSDGMVVDVSGAVKQNVMVKSSVSGGGRGSFLYAGIGSLPLDGNNQEAVLVRPETKRKRGTEIRALRSHAYLTRSHITAQKWDFGWYSRSWRIMRYPRVVRVADPGVASFAKSSGTGYLSRRATILLFAMHVDPADGVTKPVKVPAALLGWRDIEATVPCVFAPSHERRRVIADSVRRSHPWQVWWWAWVRGEQVTPVTLEPMSVNDRPLVKKFVEAPISPNKADEEVVLDDVVADLEQGDD